MIRRIASAAILALAVAAPTLLIPATSHAAFFHGGAKAKNVKMTLKNRTSEPMELTIEDKQVTLAPNAEYALNVPEGTKVYDSKKEVRVTATRDLDGTTCSFN